MPNPPRTRTTHCLYACPPHPPSLKLRRSRWPSSWDSSSWYLSSHGHTTHVPLRSLPRLRPQRRSRTMQTTRVGRAPPRIQPPLSQHAVPGHCGGRRVRRPLWFRPTLMPPSASGAKGARAAATAEAATAPPSPTAPLQRQQHLYLPPPYAVRERPPKPGPGSGVHSKKRTRVSSASHGGGAHMEATHVPLRGLPQHRPRQRPRTTRTTRVERAPPRIQPPLSQHAVPGHRGGRRGRRPLWFRPTLMPPSGAKGARTAATTEAVGAPPSPTTTLQRQQHLCLPPPYAVRERHPKPGPGSGVRSTVRTWASSASHGLRWSGGALPQHVQAAFLPRCS